MDKDIEDMLEGILVDMIAQIIVDKITNKQGGSRD